MIKQFVTGFIITLCLLLGLTYIDKCNQIKRSTENLKYVPHKSIILKTSTVKVIGAVYFQGTYPIKGNRPRIYDLIKSAGGFTPNANLDNINLAQDITNAYLVLIPNITQDKVIILKTQSLKNKKRKKKLKSKHKRKKKQHKIRYTEIRFFLSTVRAAKSDNTALKDLDTFDNAINSAITSSVKTANPLIPAKNRTKKIIQSVKPVENKIPDDTEPAKPSKININEASIDELILLPGIGKQMAQKILDYRSQNKLLKPEDLLNIKGIGRKKLEKLLPYIEFTIVLPEEPVNTNIQVNEPLNSTE